MFKITPAARTIASLVEWRTAGLVLISRAAATPTLRACQSALWAGGVPRFRRNLGTPRAGLAGGGARNQYDTRIPQEDGYITADVVAAISHTTGRLADAIAMTLR
jgi:hypothetical protein